LGAVVRISKVTNVKDMFVVGLWTFLHLLPEVNQHCDQ